MASMLLWGLSILILSATAAAENETVEPVFEAGQTQRVEMDGVGGGFFEVYVPTDYVPDLPHPVIINYHGLNGNPTTEPFKQNLDGKTFIIVGMEYFERGLTKRTRAERDAYNRQEADAATLVVKYIDRHLNIDREQLFIGGVSKGGWQSSSYAEVNFDTWAGLLIIAAGRGMPESHLEGVNLRNKPIYIGVGETDNNNKAGRKAKEAYSKRGVRVVFEEYAGLSHASKPDSQVMNQFLLDNGPLRKVNALIDVAAEAEADGRLGAAYRDYGHAAAMLAWHERGIEATQQAERLRQIADKQLTEGQQLVDGGEFVNGFKVLHAVSSTFAESKAGEEAAALLAQYKADPELRERLQQAEIDQQADHLESLARTAEQEQDYAKALRLYERYVETLANATRYDQVKAHYETLSNDKKLVAQARDQEAESDCREWQSMAENYLNADRPEVAATYFNKIVDTYPESSWAAEARKQLKQLNR